jgi:hypothetical protein
MTIRKLLLSACIAAALATPSAFAHGNGGAHGMTVSQAAATARANGTPVGPAVRDVARSNSEGSVHASANAHLHANANSDVASGTGATQSKATKAGTSDASDDVDDQGDVDESGDVNDQGDIDESAKVSGSSTVQSKTAKTRASQRHGGN